MFSYYLIGQSGEPRYWAEKRGFATACMEYLRLRHGCACEFSLRGHDVPAHGECTGVIDGGQAGPNRACARRQTA